jgi:hypothetical protein
LFKGELTRRVRRLVSFVVGVSAVLVALELMAVADGGGKLPAVRPALAHDVADAAPRTVPPPSFLHPVNTPITAVQPQTPSTPAAPARVVIAAAEAATPNLPTERVRVDISTTSVTASPVTAPRVGTKPRPEPANVLSSPTPPGKTPPTHQFGGAASTKVHGSGRGLGHVR